MRLTLWYLRHWLFCCDGCEHRRSLRCVFGFHVWGPSTVEGRERLDSNLDPIALVICNHSTCLHCDEWRNEEIKTEALV